MSLKQHAQAQSMSLKHPNNPANSSSMYAFVKYELKYNVFFIINMMIKRPLQFDPKRYDTAEQRIIGIVRTRFDGK